MRQSFTSKKKSGYSSTAKYIKRKTKKKKLMHV